MMVTKEIVLRPCPCCGADANVHPRIMKKEVLVLCSKWGCKQVTAKTVEDAVKIWNELEFRDAV